MRFEVLRAVGRYIPFHLHGVTSQKFNINNNSNNFIFTEYYVEL
jgi:hypothetical protein